MDQITRQKELARFAALTPEQATAILAEMEGLDVAFRSCWYCSGTHEHLKDAPYPITCISGCGITYLKGFPARIVWLRSGNQPITEEIMTAFEVALVED